LRIFFTLAAPRLRPSVLSVVSLGFRGQILFDANKSQSRSVRGDSDSGGEGIFSTKDLY